MSGDLTPKQALQSALAALPGQYQMVARLALNGLSDSDCAAIVALVGPVAQALRDPEAQRRFLGNVAETVQLMADMEPGEWQDLVQFMRDVKRGVEAGAENA